MPKRERIIFESHAPMWRIRDIVHHLGGVGPLAEKLMAKGYRPPAADTMQGWVTRNSIPSPWVPAVLGIAMDEQLIAHPEELLYSESK
jgi:hypothetical protein